MKVVNFVEDDTRRNFGGATRGLKTIHQNHKTNKNLGLDAFKTGKNII